MEKSTLIGNVLKHMSGVDQIEGFVFIWDRPSVKTVNMKVLSSVRKFRGKIRESNAYFYPSKMIPNLSVCQLFKYNSGPTTDIKHALNRRQASQHVLDIPNPAGCT